MNFITGHLQVRLRTSKSEASSRMLWEGISSYSWKRIFSENHFTLDLLQKMNWGALSSSFIAMHCIVEISKTESFSQANFCSHLRKLGHAKL